MGGRAAEELIFGDITSGAANDIGQATRIARYMVMEFGMSSLGPVNFGPNIDVTEWGKTFAEQPPISQEMMAAIDREVKAFVDEGHKTAVAILKKRKAQLDMVAKELVEKETLEGDDFDRLMKASVGSVKEKKA